ncbi:MAG: beta-hydroxyacyl-ACP dehydratase [bacterium]|nr:beta-hydroxyacyl-ACP dehydratase [bacterium]
MRFHLVDRIDEIQYGNYIIGVKCITLADDVFNEHFPGHPIFPGSLLQEGLAQLSGSFFELTMDYEKQTPKHAVVSIVNKMKFRRPAEPGDKLIYRADIKVMHDDYGVTAVKATLDGTPIADGELTFSFIRDFDQNLYESRQAIYKSCMRKTRIIPSEPQTK